MMQDGNTRRKVVLRIGKADGIIALGAQDTSSISR